MTPPIGAANFVIAGASDGIEIKITADSRFMHEMRRPPKHMRGFVSLPSARVGEQECFDVMIAACADALGGTLKW
jgi:hypothetical protein